MPELQSPRAGRVRHGASTVLSFSPRTCTSADAVLRAQMDYEDYDDEDEEGEDGVESEPIPVL